MRRLTIRVRFGLLCLVVLLLTGYASRSAHAAPQLSAVRISQSDGRSGNAVVQPPCNEAAFNTALATVQDTIFGGTITFNCPDPTIIPFTGAKTIFRPVIIDGGGTVTLSGSNATRHFAVTAEQLTIRNITLTAGNGNNTPGGSTTIAPGAAFVAENARIERNNAGTGSGSALYATGSAAITLRNSIVELNNTSGYGAINSTGPLTIEDSVLQDNRSVTGGGALSVGGTVSIIDTVIQRNTTDGGVHPLFHGGGAILITPVGNLTMTGGALCFNESLGRGGAVDNRGNATFRNLQACNNSGGVSGGAFYNSGGNLLIEDALLSDNEAAFGGAIRNQGFTTIVRSTLTGNHAVLGGALYNEVYDVEIYDSTFTGNSADNGGAIYEHDGSLLLVNSTLSGNSAIRGGAIESRGSESVLIYVTIANNSASEAGSGIFSAYYSGTVQLTNTLLANSEGNCSVNVSPGITSGGFNISSDASCNSYLNATGDRHSTDPLLGALADNGGPTLTHLPAANSLAIEGAICLASYMTDQRGAARPAGAACDAGAVEVGGQIPTAITLVRQSAGHAAGWRLVVAVCLCLPLVWVGRRAQRASA